MDFSSIWNMGTLVVSGGSAFVGGALGMFVKGIDARLKLAKLNRELAKLSRELQEAKDEAQARRAAAVRVAREAAGGLEAYAYACDALLTENARADRAGDAISFRLPKLAPGGQAGDSPDALELESAYRDLEQQVRAANDHIAETSRDTYHAGPEEALVVLDARAYETAASALKLAGRYRERFDVPRMPLGRREQRIEDAILSRAAEEDAASTTDH